MERDAGGAHNKSARVVQFCFESRTLEIIWYNKKPREFCQNNTIYSDIGPIFVDQLPTNCFTIDGKFVVLHSNTPFSSKPFVIDLHQKQLIPLNHFPKEHCKILDIKQNVVISIGSSLNYSPNVYLCNIDDFSKLNSQGLLFLIIVPTSWQHRCTISERLQKAN